MSTVERFQAAVDVIRGLPKQGSFQPSSEMQLKFYSFYKQATEGPCTNPKPSFWDIVGRAKWDAWKKLENMPQEEAMEKYVDELKEVIGLLKTDSDQVKSNTKIVETMSYTESVSKFLDLLGPFYEAVPLDKAHAALNGDHDSTDEVEEIPSAQEIVYSKGEKKGRGANNNVRVNGYGDPGELDSDGDEFSDTYDNIKEPLEDGDGDISSLAVLGNGDGGGLDSESQEEQTLSNGDTDTLTNNGFDTLTLEDSSYSLLNSIEPSNGHCYQDSPARHSHPAMSPNRIQGLSNHDHSYSQPILLQESENQFWAIPREEVLNSVSQFNGCVMDGVVQARGGSDQTLGPVNPRTSSSVGSGGGAGTSNSGRAQRNRGARDGSSAQAGDRLLGAGGGGRDPEGSQGGAYSGVEVSDQLALAVIKLQHSMDEVNNRLAMLEANLQGRSPTHIVTRKGMWSSLGVSPQLLFLILAWPFLAHWIIHMVRKRSQQ